MATLLSAVAASGDARVDDDRGLDGAAAMDAESYVGAGVKRRANGEVGAHDARGIDAEIARRIEGVHDELLGSSAGATLADMLEDATVVGPASVTCGMVDGSGGYRTAFTKSYGSFAAEGERAGVPIRSISKIFMAVTTFRLMELVNEPENRQAYAEAHARLAALSGAVGVDNHASVRSDDVRQRGKHFDLDTTLAEFFPEACSRSTLGGSSIRSMLNLSTNLDNRLNAMWKISRDIDDHAGFPNYCDENGLNAMECVEHVICPAYTPRTGPDLEEAAVVVGTVPASMAAAARRARSEECNDDADGDSCRAMAAQGHCGYSLRYVEHFCKKTCGICVDHEVGLRTLMRGYSERASDDPLLAHMHNKGQTWHKRAMRTRIWRGEWEAQDVSDDHDDDDHDDDDRDADADTDGDDHDGQGNVLMRSGGGKVTPPRTSAASARRSYAFGEWDDADVSRVATVGETEAEGMEMVYKPSVSCVYDNYSSTLIDAIVMRVTGRNLNAWSVALVAEPLQLEDMMRCSFPTEDDFIDDDADVNGGRTARGVRACYAPLSTYDEQVQQLSGEPWRLWRGGFLSDTWSSVSLIASSLDIAKLMAAIMNRGLYRTKNAEGETKRLLSDRWIEMMLTREEADGSFPNENRQRTHCQCAESMSLGIGVCHRHGGGEHALNMCEAEEYYLWGSTYGSRALGMDVSMEVFSIDDNGLGGWIVDDVQYAPEDVTSVVCGTNVLLSPAKFFSENGDFVRLAQRQHKFAHKQAKLLRAFLPRPARR